MADYGRKIQSDNKHLANLTSARHSIHIDGGNTAPITVRAGAGRLLRVVIFAKGLAFTIRDGTDVLAVIATTTVEGTYDVGVYVNTNININGISGTGSALIVFGD